MVSRGTDGGHNTFPYPSKNSLFTSPPYQLSNVCSNCNSRFGNQLNAVSGNSANIWGVDVFGIHRDLNRLEYIPSRKIYGCSLFKRYGNVRFIGRNQSSNNSWHVAAI